MYVFNWEILNFFTCLCHVYIWCCYVTYSKNGTGLGAACGSVSTHLLSWHCWCSVMLRCFMAAASTLASNFIQCQSQMGIRLCQMVKIRHLFSDFYWSFLCYCCVHTFEVVVTDILLSSQCWSLALFYHNSSFDLIDVVLVMCFIK